MNVAHSESKNKQFRANAVSRKAKAQAKSNERFAQQTDRLIKKFGGK